MSNPVQRQSAERLFTRLREIVMGKPGQLPGHQSFTFTMDEKEFLVHLSDLGPTAFKRYLQRFAPATPENTQDAAGFLEETARLAALDHQLYEMGRSAMIRLLFRGSSQEPEEMFAQLDDAIVRPAGFRLFGILFLSTRVDLSPGVDIFLDLPHPELGETQEKIEKILFGLCRGFRLHEPVRASFNITARQQT